tara:strand:- start:1000 stop:2004 length:1005 start_codon:yes stop_codon:yes gene_type:complete
VNTDEERDDKLKELEDKLENALERIDELEDQPPSEEGDEQQDSIQIESAGEAPFRVHWIDPSVETSVSCGDIDSVKKAQDAFAEANVYRNANAHRIMHGDVLILMCNYASVSDACYYVGLCVVTNTPNQVGVPASPDLTSDSGTKEFMAWFTCPGEGGTSCIPDGSETLVPHVSDVSWNDPSLGSDGVKTHVITFTKKELVFDSCGGYIRSDSASPEEITIKECCDTDDPPTNYNDCSQFASMPSTITLKETDSQGTVTNTTLYKYTVTPEFCRYTDWDPASGGNWNGNNPNVRFDSVGGFWKVQQTGMDWATNPLLFGSYTTINSTSTFEVSP